MAAHTDGRGFDVVYDSLGGANLSQSIAACALNAQLATTVSLVELDLSAAHFKGLSLHVVFMLIPMPHDVGREAHHEVLVALASIVESGALTPLVDPNEFGLSQVAEAHARLGSGEAVGKVVVSVEAQ